MADSAVTPPNPLVELVETMAKLRRECAWKAAQTHESLTRYLLEETYEVLEAIESGDRTHLREELGDLLLQVYFHAAIAAEAGEYDVADVAADLQAKLVRRNPHVFGGPGAEPLTDLGQINDQWEAIKTAEKQRTRIEEGLPGRLPAMLRADKLVDRLARAGRPVSVDPADPDLGERLLGLVVEAQSAGIDPEQALRTAVRRRLEESGPA
ncbi:MAG: MazG family protein [Actinomycetota bacterium]|nr:MazG family protein [Actinomycetota bacterium]